MSLSLPPCKERSASLTVRAMPVVAAKRLANVPRQDRGEFSQDLLWPAEARRAERYSTSGIAVEAGPGECPNRSTPLPTSLPGDSTDVRFSAMSVAVGVAFLFLCKPSADDQGQKRKLRA